MKKIIAGFLVLLVAGIGLAGINPPGLGTSDVSSNVDVAANTSARHTQNTDQYLDYGGANQSTAADVKDAVSKKHVAVTAGSGISVTGQQVANTDKGTTAVSSHEGTYVHGDIALNTGARHTRKHNIDGTDDHNGVSGATENNFVSFNANGLPKDSGKKHSDYAASSHGHTASQVSDFDTEVGNHADVSANTSARHAAVTAGTGISVAGQQVTNTDTGSGAVSSHNGTYAHGDIATNTGARHSHTNKSLLDELTLTDTELKQAGFNLVIEDSSGIDTGIKADIVVPYDCTIKEVVLLADQSGDVVLDIWKDTYANFAPTVADTITASAKPTLSSALKSQDSTLTGWTTSLTAGDVLRFNVDSVATITRLTIFIKLEK